MRTRLVLAVCLFAVPGLVLAATAPSRPSAGKEAAVAAVQRHRPELVDLATQVWGFAETALRETKSAKLLADYAEKQGFRTVTYRAVGLGEAAGLASGELRVARLRP